MPSIVFFPLMDIRYDDDSFFLVYDLEIYTHISVISLVFVLHAQVIIMNLSFSFHYLAC